MAALPTGSIRLSDIIAHFTTAGLGPFTKFSECMTAFNPDGANVTYYSAPVDRFNDFRGYDHPIDTTPPDKPATPTSSNISTNSFLLSWTTPNDDVGVTGYKVYYTKSGGSLTLYADTGNANTSLSIINQPTGEDLTSWQIEAYDAAGNISTISDGVLVSLLRQSVQISTTGETTSGAACSPAAYTTRYFAGAGISFPLAGDIIYTASSGTGTAFDGGDNWFGDNNTASSYQIDKSGNVANIASCP